MLAGLLTMGLDPFDAPSIRFEEPPVAAPA